MQKRLIIAAIAVFVLLVLVYVGRELFEMRGLQKKIKLIELELKALPREEKLPPYLAEGDIPYLVRELIAKLPSGLKFELNRVIPQAVKTEGELRKFGVELEFTSDFRNLKSYLTRLSSMKTPVYVDRVSIRSAEEGKISGKLWLNFVLLPGKSVLTATPEAYAKKPAEVKIVKRVKKEKLSLQGIWKGKETKAIINDQIVGAGEEVSGYKVLEIGENQVILEKAGRKVNLKMEEKP